MTPVANTFNFNPITTEKVIQALSQLNPKKAPGIDGISIKPLLKSDTAIQRYSDTRSQSQSQSHANFPGGVNFRPYKVKYLPGKVKTHKDSKGGRL